MDQTVDYEAFGKWITNNEDAKKKLLPILQNFASDLENCDLVPEFAHPFNMIVGGPSQVGKTYTLQRMLRDRQIEPYPDEVHLFYGVYQDVFEDMKNEGLITEHHQGTSKATEIIDSDYQVSKLLIFDDLQTEISTKPMVSDMFRCGSHHKNASIAIVWQNIFPKGQFARDLSLNAHYTVFFKHPVTAHQFNLFAHQRKMQYEHLWTLFAMMSNDNRIDGPMVVDNIQNAAWFGYEPIEKIYQLYDGETKKKRKC